MSRKYIIINTDELNSLDFSKLTTTSKDTVRKKSDNSQAIVAFEGATPSELLGKTDYTIDQLLLIIDDTDNGWYIEDEDE
mgnify:FL=1